MNWFRFSQNNTGGNFEPPARDVFVEAETPREANYRAEDLGIYFDGCELGVDCPCCGDRWYSAGDYSVQEDGPEIYVDGDYVPVHEVDYDNLDAQRWYGKEAPAVMLYHRDGTKEILGG